MNHSANINELLQSFESLSGMELGRFCLERSGDLCGQDFVKYFDSARHFLDDIHLSEGLNILINIKSDEAILIASEYLSHPTTFVRMPVILSIREGVVTSAHVIKRIVSAILTLCEYKNTVYSRGPQATRGIFPVDSAFGLEDLYNLLKKSLSLETEHIIRPLLASLAGKLGDKVYDDFPACSVSNRVPRKNSKDPERRSP